MSENNIVEIILVEDNSDDAELTIRALKKYNLANHLLHLEDGEDAINYIFSQDTVKLPKLILLDLKLPKVDGLEVLRKIKSDEEKKVIPVVVLTSSKEEQDIVKSYELGVNAYIVKPVEFEGFTKAVSDLGLFWMVFNQPPAHSV
jgi:two-component system, response regulator